MSDIYFSWTWPVNKHQDSLLGIEYTPHTEVRFFHIDGGEEIELKKIISIGLLIIRIDIVL